MNRLAGKIALITGAGKGIGEAIAREFLQEGIAGLALLDYDAPLVEATAARLDPEGTRALAISCDVSDKGQVERAVAKAVERFGKIDVLVNNAGVIRDAMFHKMTDEQWDAVIQVSFNGTYHLTKYVMPLMREQGGGSIITLSSINASGSAGQANYSAAKAGVIGFTKALAKEGGRKNIRANTISPGYIDTDILKTVPDDILKGYIDNVPMGRLGRPSEVAMLAVFLASDESSFISGQDIIISGGSNT